MRITSRTATDRIRATRSHTDISAVKIAAPERATPPRQAEGHAAVAALSDALQTLPAAQRECWVLREIGGYTYEEIADELDISLSTGGCWPGRAKKSLSGWSIGDERSRYAQPLGMEPEDLDGHTIEELSDYLDKGRTPANPPIDESAGCQIVLDALERLRPITF